MSSLPPEMAALRAPSETMSRAPVSSTVQPSGERSGGGETMLRLGAAGAVHALFGAAQAQQGLGLGQVDAHDVRRAGLQQLRDPGQAPGTGAHSDGVEHDGLSQTV